MGPAFTPRSRHGSETDVRLQPVSAVTRGGSRIHSGTRWVEGREATGDRGVEVWDSSSRRRDGIVGRRVGRRDRRAGPSTASSGAQLQQ